VKQNATLDSSFWINAHRSGLLPYVLDRYDLTYASHVAEELREDFPAGREFWRLVRLGRLTEVEPIDDHLRNFGPGERSAISVAIEHRDWVLLLDDQRPFQEAARIGLWVLCSPVVVVALHIEGTIDANKALTILARLAAIQTVSPTLIALALSQLGKSLPGKEGT
jgi:predicted nucleic acid-binding protein